MAGGFNFNSLMQQALQLMQNPTTWAQGMAMMNQLNNHQASNAQLSSTIGNYIMQIEANPSQAQSIVMMASMTNGLPDNVKMSLTSILPMADNAAKAKAAADALGATAQDKSNYTQAQSMLIMACSQVMQAVQSSVGHGYNNSFPLPFGFPSN